MTYGFSLSIIFPQMIEEYYLQLFVIVANHFYIKINCILGYVICMWHVKVRTMSQMGFCVLVFQYESACVVSLHGHDRLDLGAL